MKQGQMDEGVTSQGAATESHDKYGKRMWVATPVRDMSKKDKSGLPHNSRPTPVSSDQTRTDNGTK